MIRTQFLHINLNDHTKMTQKNVQNPSMQSNSSYMVMISWSSLMNVSSPFSIADLYFFLLGRPQTNLKKGCYQIFLNNCLHIEHGIVSNTFECKHTINCMDEQKIIYNRTLKLTHSQPYSAHTYSSTLFHLCFCSQMPSLHLTTHTLANNYLVNQFRWVVPEAVHLFWDGGKP